jgi:tetratricopeptide (TPR) repeat protein
LTGEEAQALYRQAFKVYNAGEFPKAISLYNKLLEGERRNPSLLGSVGINIFEVRKFRAISFCKSGRYAEAENELKDLQAVVGQYGGRSSQMKYWELVAHHKGDAKKAMDEWITL